MYRSFVVALIFVSLYFVFQYRHRLLYPKFEVTYRKVAKVSGVTGPWSMKHRNFAVYALRGRRVYMEDRFSIIDNEQTGEQAFWIFGVYDGHGGSFFCDYAEKHLLRAIRRRIVRATPGIPNVTSILIEEILKLDEEARKEGGNSWSTSGTAVIVGLVHHQKLYIANVGDARAVIRKMDGKVVETHDHLPNVPAEKQRIVEAGGAVIFNGAHRVAGVLGVSRSVGDGVFKKRGWLITTPDIYVFDLKRNPVECVIMATDGIWDVFKSREASEFIKPHMHEMFYGAKKLAKEALKRGSHDNILVMVVQFQGLQGSPRTEVWE